MANKIISNKSVTKKATKKKEKKAPKTKSSNSSFVLFLKNPKFHLILGVFLFLFTIFLFSSFISFFYTYVAVDLIYNANFIQTLTTSDKAAISLGILGLYF